MTRAKVPRSPLIPAVAAGLALLLLAAPLWPPLFPAAIAAASLATCALVLARRPSPALRHVLVALAVWLLFGLGGAWVLRGRPLPGLMWVLAVLYLAPLPVIPLLYWKTFQEGDE
jgi:hypothetical protein